MTLQPQSWVVVTGGGTGIGRALVHHFSRTHNVLTCGRREIKLRETKSQAMNNPGNIHFCAPIDISKPQDRERLHGCLPQSASVSLLIQNAAIGDPGYVEDTRESMAEHLEDAFRTNVTAPLALVQLFLPNLREYHRKSKQSARVLHLGTSVAHNPQKGTLVYGVTKMAFHRLFLQLNAEQIRGVVCASVSPGMVKTEGTLDHVVKAKALGLPHANFLEEAFSSGTCTQYEGLLAFVDFVLAMDDTLLTSKEWKYSEWRLERSG